MSTLVAVPSTDGELLGSAFAALVEERGLEDAWDILELVREDGTDSAAVAYNMDARGAWLFAGPTTPRTQTFFAYPAP